MFFAAKSGLSAYHFISVLIGTVVQKWRKCPVLTGPRSDMVGTNDCIAAITARFRAVMA